jgi:predicted MFS family arabinose efflux permease
MAVPTRAPSHALTAAVAAAVAVAFADSSIVVLALPDLYLELGTSITGIAWVITSYNLVVAIGAFALLPLARRIHTATLVRIGLVVFLAACIGCALSNDLTMLIAFRCLQGLGGVLTLVGSLPLLAGLTGSSWRGAVVWTLAGTLGAALGPALGGLLTDLFSWQAIFVAQAPLVGVALLATFGAHLEDVPAEPDAPAPRPSLAAHLGIALVFGALVGALFLAVLMLVAVWGLSPLAAAAVVTALPVATLAARPLSVSLSPRTAAVSGAAFLAAGLAGLALLPSTSEAIAAVALALCGVGLGLAVPVLSHATISPEHGLTASGAWSIGARHVGLVLALVLIAPLLAYELDKGADTATLKGAAVILDAPIQLTRKVPIALGLRDSFEQAQKGEVPDLDQVFESHGAGDDPNVARTRDDLLGAIQDALTRSFRSSYGLAALLAGLAIVPVLLVRRLEIW